MKIYCEICGERITDISVSKTYEVRDDYEVQPSSGDFLMGPNDREYFTSSVNALYYKCKCGQITIKSNLDPNIIDFIRDSKRLNPNDLAYDHYGSLKVEK